jgi:Ca2+-binding RTX toxin-like protein
MAIIIGDDGDQFIFGTFLSDNIQALGGDDFISANVGNDTVRGGNGFDMVYGDDGDDILFGGAQNDYVNGGAGHDRLYGDSGRGTVKGSDLGSDRLNGGDGHDLLLQGDGNDVFTGGEGRDAFFFRWQDPMVALAAGTGRAFTTLTDYDPNTDRLLFDAAGIRNDLAGANFINGGGANGGVAASFFKGAAASSNGEAVMIITDQAFASGQDAVNAAQNEAMGDFVLYFNSTVNAASLLFVDGANMAHSIARFTNIDSLADLQATNFAANDFFFV